MLGVFLRSSMKNKLLFAFLLVGVVPLLITSIISGYQSYQNDIKSSYQENSQLSQNLATSVDSMIQKRMDVLHMASQLPQIQSMDPAQILPVLKVLKQQYPDFAYVAVADTAGQQIARDNGNLAKIPSDRSYFKGVMQGGAVAISEVILAPATGRQSIIICLPVKNGQGALNGVILATLDLTEIGDKAQKVKTGQTGYAFITDNLGKLIYHPEKELVNKQTDFSDLPPVQQLLSQKNGYTVYEYQGEVRLAGYSYMPSTGWGVVVQLPKAEAMFMAKKHLLIMFGMLVVTILLVIAIALAIARSISKPLVRVVQGTQAVADGDLTQQLPVESRDETGKLSESFNKMITELRILVKHIYSNAEQLAAASEELTASADQSARAANQVAVSITDVAKGAEAQLTATDKTNIVVRQITESIQHVLTNANQTAQQSVQVTKKAEGGSKTVEQAVAQMSSIEQTVNVSAQVVSKLGERSQEIGNIVDTITKIAGQTNLLALNAAIEAARAGEQGRGFAVVADEVRKLAEQSQEAAKQIGDLIVDIQSDTDQAVTAMDHGTKEVKTGAEVVNAAGKVFMEIVNLVTQVSTQVTEISEDIQQMLAGSQEIVNLVQGIDDLSKKAAGEAENVSAATEEQSASMEEIASSSQSLAHLAQELHNAVNKFKI